VVGAIGRSDISGKPEQEVVLTLGLVRPADAGTDGSDA
jgi:hypothetical protein